MAKVLLLDIETSPILGYAWGIWQQNIGLNQIHKDWHVISWAAKWLGEKKVFYKDNRHAKNVEDDKELLQGIWDLLDEADVVITQNGDQFDLKKLRARFIINGMKPPSSFKSIDTKKMAKRHFGFTSNRLEYLAEKLTKKRKGKHKEFEGFELWKECLRGNIKAWNELKEYNIMDVLILEDVWRKLDPYSKTITIATYTDGQSCNCGSKEFHRNGKCLAGNTIIQRYRCNSCGDEYRLLASGKFVKTNR
jgi:hypothetical protein